MVSRNEMKENLKELIERYNKIVSSDKVKSMSEEQTKTSLIQPFFKLLNWNVEDPDEVTLEEKVSKKRVDYAFKVNGIIKFFVEAKSLKEDLNDSQYVEQAMKYSYNKGVTWAILTNFKEIMVFNAEWVPEGSNIFNNKFISLKVEEFLEEDSIDLLWLLSKESIISGELDRKAEKIGKKIKKQPIDKQLLSDLTKWRQALSKNILDYNRDKKFTEEELDEVVQRILDRLIFIRKCEDNGLEDLILKSKMREWEEKGKGFYTYIQEVFRYFDKNYDSELFKEHLSDDVVITNELLKEIISGLYETKEKMISYDFSVIDADVLGSVYEQYLGHILRKTEKRAKVTENHAHRKEQGIYYTPIYIVDYIVRSTLGELLKNKKVDVEKIRVLDPACGSGSFLIKAFDVLNEHYLKNDKDYSQTQLDLETGGKFTRKVKILQNNIFGVDLDKQAIQIAQLNLLLKIAEKGHRLPLLKESIKNGNSLIDDPTIVGDKAFKWEKEFKQILDEGGFDVVIGNPPYFKIFEKDPLNKTVDYQEIKSGMMNASALFINKSLKLLKNGGYLGMIVPKMLAFTDSWDKIRNKILKNFKILKVVDCGKAFKGVLLEQIIFILRKESDGLINNMITIGELNNQTITETAKISQKMCLEENSIHLEPNQIAYEIKKKMEISKTRLGSISKIVLGLGIQGKDFFFDESKEGFEKVLRGDDIQRYFIRGSKFYDKNDKNILKIKNTIEKFKTPHIVAQRIVAHIRDHIKITSAFDEEGLFSFNTVTNIFITDKKYLVEYALGLLNSNAVQYYTYKFIYNNAIRSMDFYKAYAEKIPLPVLNKNEQDTIAKLTRDLINLYKELTRLGDKNTDKRIKIEEEIKKVDYEINEIVYKIYGITDDEKKIIEDSLK